MPRRLDEQDPRPMADPLGPPATSAERIAWLLDFLRRDVQALRPGAWLDLRHDLQRYVWAGMSPHSPFESIVQEWHAETNRGLAALAAGESWKLSIQLSRTLRAVRPRVSDRHLMLVYVEPPPLESLLAAAIDLLAEWYPQLRRCKRCGAWFLPRHGRQIFHDAACAADARSKRAAATRKRDYHAEYVRKVHKKKPKARVERRPRGGK